MNGSRSEQATLEHDVVGSVGADRDRLREVFENPSGTPCSTAVLT